MKLVLFLGCLFVSSLFSCSSEKQEERIEVTDILTLDSAEVVYDFVDKYPVSLSKIDSLLYVISIKSDTCMSVINLNTKNMLCSFGPVGHGDNDLLNPNFILSIDSDDLLLDVGNLRRIVDVDYYEQDSIVMNDLEYPDLIFLSSELNMSDKYIVGRKIDAYDDSMFFIYNKKKEKIISVSCFPMLNYSILDYNYTYSSVLALNENKERIISGMYFFDMFHIYDLSGNRLKTIKFSDDCYPQVDRDLGRIDFTKKYNGIVRAYPTQNYCYLLRMINRNAKGFPQYMLVQMDWEGCIRRCYMFNDSVSGQFLVDEVHNKIYIIKNYIDDDGEEVFSIVSYKLE